MVSGCFWGMIDMNGGFLASKFLHPKHSWFLNYYIPVPYNGVYNGVYNISIYIQNSISYNGKYNISYNYIHKQIPTMGIEYQLYLHPV